MIILAVCLCVLLCLMAAGMLQQVAMTKKRRKKCRLRCGMYGWHYLPNGKKRCMGCGWLHSNAKGSVSHE